MKNTPVVRVFPVVCTISDSKSSNHATWRQALIM